MRLWSLHPKYLDAKGLCGLWREGLLARRVLKGETEAYKNHPQLERFETQNDPVLAIDTYLLHVYIESKKRNYNFNRSKIGSKFMKSMINVTDGQLAYELRHLKRKLKRRDLKKYKELMKIELPDPNPIFKVVKGDIEPWEIVHG